MESEERGYSNKEKDFFVKKDPKNEALRSLARLIAQKHLKQIVSLKNKSNGEKQK